VKYPQVLSAQKIDWASAEDVEQPEGEDDLPELLDSEIVTILEGYRKEA